MESVLRKLLILLVALMAGFSLWSSCGTNEHASQQISSKKGEEVKQELKQELMEPEIITFVRGGFDGKQELKGEDGWELQDGLWCQSFSFSLGTRSVHDWFSISFSRKGSDGPVVHCGFNFHDESTPGITNLTPTILGIIQPFLVKLNPQLPSEKVIAWVRRESQKTYSAISDAPQMTFGQYSLACGRVGADLVVTIDDRSKK